MLSEMPESPEFGGNSGNYGLEQKFGYSTVLHYSRSPYCKMVPNADLHLKPSEKMALAEKETVRRNENKWKFYLPAHTFI